MLNHPHPIASRRTSSDTPFSRRSFLLKSGQAGLVVTLGPLLDLSRATASTELAGGTFLGELEFLLEPELSFGQLEGTGLDGRREVDLSALDEDRLITPTSEFFIRTGVPDLLDPDRLRSLQVDGLVERPSNLAIERIARESADQGVHLLECAGNSRWRRFGLISAGRWSGVTIESFLDGAGVKEPARALRVDGFDGHTRGSTNSTIGCSWIFSLEEMIKSKAFIATRLNGKPLPLVHGAPMRLIVPGWYGCCCIKWVHRIEVIDSSHSATSQMIEFASRTHQDGTPQSASEFSPAIIDMAAMPIRVERWRLDEGLCYRIVGILWGGRQETHRLEIRTRPTDPFEPVTAQPKRASHHSWGLWSHIWKTPGAGKALIQLRVDDPSIQTRRLDAGYYVRAVEILPS